MRSINAPWAVSQDRPTTPEGILRNYLQKHPLYLPSQVVYYNQNGGGKQNIFINWQSGKYRLGPDPQKLYGRLNYFDAQISPAEKIFFLLHIEIESENRGKGWGLMLYQILEEIAQEFDCSEIKMTASGWTNTGEKRADYLVRKLGYEIINPNNGINEVRKEFK